MTDNGSPSMWGRLGMSDDGFGLVELDRPSGLLARFSFDRRNHLDLNTAQDAALRHVMRVLQASRWSGRKHVVVLTGGQGTGKSLVALALVSLLLNERNRGVAPVQLLMQGQTREQWSARLPARFRAVLDSWSGTKWIERGPHDLVIADEVHLMLPLGLGNPRSGLNEKPLPERLAELQQRLTGDPRPTYAGRADSLVYPTVCSLERGVGHVLVLIRDETQVVDRRAMTTPEFEACLSWLTELGYERSDVALAETHRTSATWTDFVNEVFNPNLACPLQAQHNLSSAGVPVPTGGSGAYFEDEGPAGLPFKAALASDVKYVEQLLRPGPHDGRGPERMLGTFGWPFTRSGGEQGVAMDVRFPGWERPWNQGRLRDWSVREPYDSSVDGVGYVKLVQGMEFAAVGVLIGPDLSWKWSDTQDSCPVAARRHRHGAWAVNRDQAFLGGGPGEISGKQLLDLSLNQVRVLLLRGRYRVVMYPHDSGLQEMLQTWFGPRTDPL